jgi:hypothetical protein
LLPEREAAPQSWHRSNGKTSFLSSHSSFSTRAEGNIPSVPRFQVPEAGTVTGTRLVALSGHDSTREN